MIDVRLQLISIFISIAFMGVVVMSFVRIQLMSLKYALLWLSTSFLVVLLCLFPNFLEFVASSLSIGLPVNALFLVGIIFLVVNLLGHTVIISKKTEMIKVLTQEVGLLKNRLEALESPTSSSRKK